MSNIPSPELPSEFPPFIKSIEGISSVTPPNAFHAKLAGANQAVKSLQQSRRAALRSQNRIQANANSAQPQLFIIQGSKGQVKASRPEGIPDFVNRVIALAALIVLSPVFLTVFLLVKLTSPGAALFVQKRVTNGGKIFPLYKFRSMVVNAEKASGAKFASKNDCRITPLGKFLRQTRLDELPQLINVIKGDMALVGPRPERPEFIDVLSQQFAGFDRRISVKAGLTGLAQIRAGYADCMESYGTKLAFDRLYLLRRSIKLDLWILCRTVGTVISGHGAQ